MDRNELTEVFHFFNAAAKHETSEPKNHSVMSTPDVGHLQAEVPWPFCGRGLS